MKPALRALPAGYRAAAEINLAKNPRLALWLNLAGFGLFFLVAAGLGVFLRAVRPEALAGELRLEGLWWAVGLLALVVANLVIHELIHGLFFYLFTGAAPVFALRLTYAYAAAPDWYLPRPPYLVVGLAPLVLIDLACLVLIAIGPTAWALPAAAVAALNTSGAVGDMLIMALVLRAAPGCLVNDRGDGVILFEKPA